MENLSAQRFIETVVKKTTGIGQRNTPKHFTNRKITEIPCLTHYSSVRPNTITTDASTKVLGATL